MTRRCIPSPSLAALLGAAAILAPGAHAQTSAGESARASYRFNEYSEDAIDASAIGSPERYHVYSQQFRLDTPTGDGAALDVTATHEVMSGSSPWYVLPGADKRPIQVLSGATIRDHRSELRATYTTGAGTSSSTAWSASYSLERDYRATAIGVERSLPLDDARTIGFGGSFSHDIVEPTDAALYGRIRHAEKNSGSLFGSISWVLDRSSVVQTGIQLNIDSGYLSDPYKLVLVGDEILADTRPHGRAESAWLLRYRRAFASRDAALHMDYRYAQDSWGVASHTIDVGWYQQLENGWRLIPALRYYGQHQARFYAPYVDSSRHFYSSDYRLGTFGSISASLNLRKRISRWEFSAGIERYHAATRFAPGGADAAVPGAVSYTRAFVGLDYLLE
ncbi:MAG: DUF3570 domain-containing protein [Rudaea sp.]